MISNNLNTKENVCLPFRSDTTTRKVPQHFA
jgi:hypothetical protein